MPQSSSRYPNYSGHLQRVSEAYPDSSAVKELSREPSKSQSRGVPPKSESAKMSSPSGGGVYSSAFAQAPGGHMGLAAGRGLPVTATESGIVNRDKTQNKDHELRALGETTGSRWFENARDSEYFPVLFRDSEFLSSRGNALTVFG